MNKTITIQDARDLSYKVTTPELFIDNVYGNKLAYYQHGRAAAVYFTPDQVEPNKPVKELK